MEDLKVSLVFTKKERPACVYWSGTSREAGSSNETKKKGNPGTESDNKFKLEDWEHKLKVDKYLEWYKTHTDGTMAWAENKGKCCYLVLQN